MRKYACFLMLYAVSAVADLQPEPLMVIKSLPDSYPPHWIIAQDLSFFHMSDGKFIVLDADSDDPTERFKGMFNGSFIAQFYQGEAKPLMYVIETFRSRGNRGERTDVLTIYDKANLSPIGEVVIPPKRVSGMPTHYYLQFVDDEKLALIYNFTPAQSVTVVDMESRTVVGEIPVPGCALVYPMAGRAFASLCGDGSMYSVQLDEDGKQASSSRTEKFFDPDNDPIMEKAAIHEGIAYFPSFDGDIIPVDLRGKTPRVMPGWSMVDGIGGAWRPGGVPVITADSKGNLFVMMHPDGGEGTHKDPGFEIWVIDTKKQKLMRRLEMITPVLAIALTRDDELLVGTTVEMNVDVYDAGSGELLRTLSNFGQETPLMLHGAH
jgi:methylamine dehydrogenase heavy chain